MTLWWNYKTYGLFWRVALVFGKYCTVLGKFEHITWLSLTKYFCDHCSRFVLQKHGWKNVTISLQVSLTKRLINSSNNNSTLTPFVKPCVILRGYLDVAIAKKFAKLACNLVLYIRDSPLLLAKIGCKNIWSVKVGVHQFELVDVAKYWTNNLASWSHCLDALIFVFH